MTLDTLIMLSGAFVAVLPFLGFPTNWDTIFLVAVGIFVVGLGIAVHRTMHKHHPDHDHQAGPSAR